MRLYLSSFRLGKHASRLAGLTRSSAPRVLLTMNALDWAPAPRREELYARLAGDFAMIGAEVQELDLRQYFSKPGILIDAFAQCDLVWASGGNAFTLLAAMRQSGFVGALKDLLDEDEVAYGGHSAGAIVATPTLEGIELVDSASPADALPMGYPAKAHWEGMGLVSYSTVPHFRSEHPESAAMDAVVEYFEARDMPYRALRDGEAILIDGDYETVLSI